jgi:hypothetical protein
MLATGVGVTVTATCAVCPSLEAVMIVDRLSAPRYGVAVTTPVPETEATVGSTDRHSTSRPVNTVPAASRVVAASSCEPPTASVTVAGATAMDATGGAETVITEIPVSVRFATTADAETLTVPGATAVTTPPDETVAVAGLALDHRRLQSAISTPDWFVALRSMV